MRTTFTIFMILAVATCATYTSVFVGNTTIYEFPSWKVTNILIPSGQLWVDGLDLK
jgi:hypothetical protein